MQQEKQLMNLILWHHFQKRQVNNWMVLSRKMDYRVVMNVFCQVNIHCWCWCKKLRLIELKREHWKQLKSLGNLEHLDSNTFILSSRDLHVEECRDIDYFSTGDRMLGMSDQLCSIQWWWGEGSHLNYLNPRATRKEIFLFQFHRFFQNRETIDSCAFMFKIAYLLFHQG